MAVVRDGSVDCGDGRVVGFADFGGRGDAAVLWCHGGPGSRREPARVSAQARALGLRLVGIDRPGYGSSPPQPGRTISGWVSDALAVADDLGVDRFVTVGTSTGGAYALALAALAPERTLGAVVCCAVTDMRWASARTGMSPAHALAVWDAPTRDDAIEAALASHGPDGSRLMASGPVPLPESDRALFADPRWRRELGAEMPLMFAWGVEGYVDDRIADRDGWHTFDVRAVTCPVVVLHGNADVIVPVAHAQHTAGIVPGAELRVLDGLGHFSVYDEILPAVTHVLQS